MAEEEVEEQSQSPSDDPFNLSDDAGLPQRKSGARSPVSTNKRAPGKTFNSRSHGKGVPTFDSQTSPEETERRLCSLFGPDFAEASENEFTLSDRLSVRDLRIVIRVLDLMPADAVNVRKPILCDCLQHFFKSERMRKAYAEWQETSRKKEIAEAPPPPGPKEPAEIKRAKSPGGDRPAPVVTRRRLGGDERVRKVVVVPRLRFDRQCEGEAMVGFLTECNRFVWELSERIGEMERAVSILYARIVELERFYQLDGVAV
jgi:hypothetical protein